MPKGDEEKPQVKIGIKLATYRQKKQANAKLFFSFWEEELLAAGRDFEALGAGGGVGFGKGILPYT